MDLKNTKVGLMGAGNMGSAILEGLLGRDLVTTGQVFVYDKFDEKAELFAKEWAVQKCDSAGGLVSQSDVLLLAIKPQDLSAAADEIREALKSEKVLISILAGMSIDKLAEILGAEVTLVRAMPNLGAKVGQSLTALTSQSLEALSLAEDIFSGCGKTLRLGEEHFDMFTALSGSGPAYFFLLMEAIAAKAEEAGLPSDTANLLASQTALGAALVAQTSAQSAGELREMVTSKGGTTAAALQVLEEKGVSKIFKDAFDAATVRSRELRQNHT